MNSVSIKILKLEHFDRNLSLPSYETKLAAGADIRACLGEGKILEVQPGQKVLVPTGLSFEIPEYYEIQVRPRSGLSFKTGLMVVNSPGTVDADYRGELKILLGNLGMKVETINHGDRVAQLIVAPVTQGVFEATEKLTETQRGSGGFGSTGRN